MTNKQLRDEVKRLNETITGLEKVIAGQNTILVGNRNTIEALREELRQTVAHKELMASTPSTRFTRYNNKRREELEKV